jgi:hypothetical protein
MGMEFPLQGTSSDKVEMHGPYDKSTTTAQLNTNISSPPELFLFVELVTER